jgi:tRNA-binding protein
MIKYEDFERVDIRVGRIIEVSLLKGGKYSTHKLLIDFGVEIGKKKSCARLVNYEVEELKNRLVLGVVNFPPRQIGTSISEVLTLGVPDENGECILIAPDKSSELGAKLF